MPARPKPVTDRRRLALLVVPLAAFAITANVGNALAPTLAVEHPAVLLALSPRIRWMLLTAPTVDAVWFFGLPLVRHVAVILLWYAFGHRYGERAVRWADDRVGRAGAGPIRRVQRAFERWRHLAVIAFPGWIVSLLAGTVAMPVAILVTLSVLSTAVRLVLIRYLAELFRGPLLQVLDFIGRNQLWLTAASIAGVSVWVWWGQRRGIGLESVEEVAEELDAAALRSAEGDGAEEET